MNTRTTLPLALIFVLALSGGALAAAPKGDSAPDNAKVRPYDNLTQAQRDKLRDMYKDFFTKTAPLRDQLNAKHLELQAVQNLPSATQADVVKIIDSITALRGQLREQRMAFKDALAKEGLPRGGWGMGHDGYGWHGGRGAGGGCPGMGRDRDMGHDGYGWHGGRGGGHGGHGGY